MNDSYDTSIAFMFIGASFMAVYLVMFLDRAVRLLIKRRRRRLFERTYEARVIKR